MGIIDIRRNHSHPNPGFVEVNHDDYDEVVNNGKAGYPVVIFSRSLLGDRFTDVDVMEMTEATEEALPDWEIRDVWGGAGAANFCISIKRKGVDNG